MKKHAGWWCFGSCLLSAALLCHVSSAADLSVPPMKSDKWLLTGIASFSSTKLITLTELLPGAQRRHWTLHEGDQIGELEILEIDGPAGVVLVRLGGQRQKLHLLTASSPSGTANEDEQRRLEFVREHARFHAEQQALAATGRQ